MFIYNYCNDYASNLEDSYITEKELKNHLKTLVSKLERV
mgnify:CR=1 FL=1